MSEQPGPCIYCGGRNYPLSMGGPAICPSCDCGNFGPFTVQRLGERIVELQARADAAEALLKHICGENENRPLPDKHFELQQVINDARAFLENRNAK